MAVQPRIRLAQPYESSKFGDEAIELAASAGLELDEVWQQPALRDIMSDTPERRWLHFECGLNVPRQNGKGSILEARELALLYGVTDEKLGVHSAHEFATSLEHFRRIEALVDYSPEMRAKVKSVRRSHGEEAIHMKDGRRLAFRTRTKSGLRGFAGVDLLVLDEAMIINEASHGSMVPTLRASQSPHGPQLLYAGSAVDQLVHDHGVVWARVRHRGVQGEDESLCYIEFSAPAEHPLEVTDEMASDVAIWLASNPALGIRISEEHMWREYRTMDPRTFAVELLGVGDYPDISGLGEQAISIEAWNALADSVAAMKDPVCLSFDVSPERHTTIVAAGLCDTGRICLELIECKSGTRWVPDRLKELYQSHDVVEIVCDGYGPSASIANQVDEAGLTVRRMNSNEHAQACGRLVDAVSESTMTHLDQDELNAAVRGAKQRPLGDAWAWSRKNSAVNIAPLVGATLALSSAIDADLGNDSVVIF